MAKKEAPCEAVMLLMQRMESHPEEFALNSVSKWHQFLNVVKSRVVDKNHDALIVLEDYEAEMLWNKYKSVGKKSLHAFVMRKILEGENDE